MPLPMREASGRRGCGSFGARTWWQMVAQNQSFSEVHPINLTHRKWTLDEEIPVESIIFASRFILVFQAVCSHYSFLVSCIQLSWRHSIHLSFISVSPGDSRQPVAPQPHWQCWLAVHIVEKLETCTQEEDARSQWAKLAPCGDWCLQRKFVSDSTWSAWVCWWSRLKTHLGCSRSKHILEKVPFVQLLGTMAAPSSSRPINLFFWCGKRGKLRSKWKMKVQFWLAFGCKERRRSLHWQRWYLPRWLFRNPGSRHGTCSGGISCAVSGCLMIYLRALGTMKWTLLGSLSLGFVVVNWGLCRW